MNSFMFRQNLIASDPDTIEDIVRSSHFFSQAEIEIARELACDRLDHGEHSSYQFLLVEQAGKVAGYTCYGLIPATSGSYDLYWIAVSKDMRGKGLGKILLQRTEEIIAGQGGRIIYAETSSRDQYVPTQLFYEHCRYIPEAVLTDFYTPGDSKIIYSKLLK